MGNYSQLKAAITEVIKQNGNQEITGNVLQTALLTIINNLGVGSTFVGVANPATIPNTSDRNVFYIASESGIYANFDGIQLSSGEIGVFVWNGSWSIQKLAIKGGGGVTGNLTGYVAIDNESELPESGGTLGYLIDGNLFVYVGEGGNAANGRYENVGALKGDKGDKGDQGNSGYQGAASELEIVNSLTKGGPSAALSAEMGKQLYDYITTIEYRLFEYEVLSGRFDGSSVVEASGFATTSEIDISGHARIFVSTKANVPVVYFLDGSHNKIGQVDAGVMLEGYSPIDVPDGAMYVRVNANTDSTKYPFVYYATYINVLDEVKESITVFEERRVAYNIVSGLIPSTGVGNSDHSGYYTTSYIDVSEVRRVKISASATGWFGVMYGYTKDQYPVRWIVGKGSYNDYIVEIPVGIDYIRVNGTGVKVSIIVERNAIAKLEDDVINLRQEVFSDYISVTYNENDNQVGFWGADGVIFTNYSGYVATPFIDVRDIDKVYIDDSMVNTGLKVMFGYDADYNFVEVLLSYGVYVKQEVDVSTISYVKLNGQGYIPKVYKKGIGVAATKKKLAKNVNWVGMSLWWYDGRSLGSGNGGGVVAKGYQSWLRDQYSFDSDSGTIYCYSGGSLGGTSVTDSSCIMANTSTWEASDNAIWTLDTITNDFRRNIPIGTIDDYTNSTGVTTYYGALRAFADKVAILSPNAIVIASNAIRRNNSNYTSTSKNSLGYTLEDYEVALMNVVMLNNWFFVDQFRLSGVTDTTLTFTTIDGLHLNNNGYRLAVLPWIQVFDMIYNSML